jgi:hygromycin-B 7''-O-kinase
MENITLDHIFSSINSFEEFEKLKLNIKFLESVAEEIMQRHQLPEASLELYSEGTNIVFACGASKVIKIFPPFHQASFKSDLLVLKHLEGKCSIKTPVVEVSGELAGWPYIIMNKLEGTLLETLWEKMGHDNKVVIIRELGSLIKEIHALPTDGLEEIDCGWDKFIEIQIAHCVEQHRSKGLSQRLTQQIPSYIESIKESLPKIKKPVLLTGEYTPMNFLVKEVDGIWHIDGLIDFGDSMLGLPEYDLLGPGAFLIQGDKSLLKSFLSSYGYTPEEMTETLSHQLTALLLLHKYSNLNVQVRILDWKKRAPSLKELENLVWGF